MKAREQESERLGERGSHSTLLTLSRSHALTLAVVLLALLVPVATERQDILNLFFLIYLFMTLGQSWNILGGFAGQINLGHAAFFGTGALVTRSLWTAGQPFGLALLAGGLAALLFGLVIGVPTFRLRGVYFSMGTLALAEALRITVANALPLVSALPTDLVNTYDLASRYELALALAAASPTRSARTRRARGRKSSSVRA